MTTTPKPAREAAETSGKGTTSPRGGEERHRFASSRPPTFQPGSVISRSWPSTAHRTARSTWRSSAGVVAGQENVPVRLHSESCLTGDTFGSLRCDCREQLELALKEIDQRRLGVLLYMRQEGRGIGLANRSGPTACRRKGSTRSRRTRRSASVLTSGTTRSPPAGRPVLISNQVNLWPEIKDDGVSIVEDDTLEGTVRLLRRWFDLLPAERAAMAARAQACFAARFSMKNTVAAMRGVFEPEISTSRRLEPVGSR